jgi:hypothetical protein
MFYVKDSLDKKERIRYLNSNCEILHLTRSFPLKSIKKILKKCNKLKRITVSKSTKKRLSKKVINEIRKKGISIYTKNEQGRAIEIKIDKLQKLLNMYKDYSYRELSQQLNVPKSTIHYIIKYSKRKKIKDGKKIIYLK